MNDSELTAALTSVLSRALGEPISAADVAAAGGYDDLRLYEGKVRDCYISAARGHRILVASDRLSAFDHVIDTIPCKGQVLNQLAAFWFEQTSHLVPNHVLSVPDAQVTIGRELMPIAAEFVVRAYLTGVTSTSIWRAYEQGHREFAGHALPNGLVKNAKLPHAIVTPSTKAAHGDHDETVSRAQLLARGEVTAEVFDRAAALALTLFAHGQAYALTRGLILADTKYEFGLNAAGEVVVMDEIHTPDSSRYWFADDFAKRHAAGEEPRSLDKEFVRRFLAEELGYRGDGPPPRLPDSVRVEAALRYVRNYEMVTGREFVPDLTDPRTRILAALRQAKAMS